MEKSNIYQIRVKARIYAGEKFIYPVTFPVSIEAPNEEAARERAAETLRSLRVDSAVALGRHGYAEAKIPLEAVGVRYKIEGNPMFLFRGVRFEKDSVKAIAVYDASHTVAITFTSDGQEDTASFGGYPISGTDWKTSIDSLFSTIGISR